MDNCFECGDRGHLARDCPQRLAQAEQRQARPVWCGNCNQQTRLIEGYNIAWRCPTCHPLRYVPLKQHKKCGGCRMTIYTWDNAPCGKHQLPVTS